MRIRIKDFGPVAEGVVDLKPLTIFVGPNNSGKSYVATLVHSIVSAENYTFPPSGTMWERWAPADRSSKELYERAAEIVRTCNETPTLEDFLGLQERITGQMQGSFDGRLEASIMGNFGSDLPSLVRAGRDAARISVDGGFSASLSDKASVTHARDTAMDPDDRAKLEVDLYDVMDAPLPETTMGRGDAGLIAKRIVRLLTGAALGSARIAGIPSSTFYFPAARSGLIQGHKALSAAIVQNARFGGTREPRAPVLNGVASGFIAGITMLEDEPGELHNLGEEMEAEILGGRISLKEGVAGQSYEIFYSTDTSSIPLHKASSTISEVSPISLYLKHIARPGSLLIIEEPEAHLHLANQAEMAKYIVRMVRASLNVLVITHSSAIIDELSMYIQSSKANTEVRKEVGLEPIDVLKLDEVAPYFFDSAPESGYTIKEIKADTRVGIPHVDYGKVLERLFNRTARIEHETPDN